MRAGTATATPRYIDWPHVRRGNLIKIIGARSSEAPRGLPHNISEWTAVPNQDPDYDVIRRAAVLAENPYHANTYDVKQMALRILHYERNAQQANNRRGRAGQMYSKG
jgi:hypothetical protein